MATWCSCPRSATTSHSADNKRHSSKSHSTLPPLQFPTPHHLRKEIFCRATFGTQGCNQLISNHVFFNFTESFLLFLYLLMLYLLFPSQAKDCDKRWQPGVHVGTAPQYLVPRATKRIHRPQRGQPAQCRANGKLN